MKLRTLSSEATVTLPLAALLVISLASPVLAPPGDLDSSFDGDGKVTTGFSPGDRVPDYVQDVALQVDEKIVAVGATLASGTLDFGLARYYPDGSPDGSFGGGDGTVTTGFGSTDHASSIAIQEDGKLVVAGTARVSANDDFAVARYNMDGSLDTTFDGDGKVTTDFLPGSLDQATATAIQDDGKIVVAGFSYAQGTSDFALARYNPDGSLDTTFGGGDGKTTTDFGLNDFSQAYDMVIQEDNKIVAAGTFVPSGTLDYDFALARYDSTGSLDTSFGSGDGKVTTGFFSNSRDQVQGLAVQADGRIVAVGCVFCLGQPTAFALARYTADGSLDPSFDGDGMATTSLGSPNSQAFDVAIQGDGKLAVAGCVFCGSVDADFGLARFGPDASLDVSFGGGDGIVTTDIAFGRDEAASIAIQPDTKIVVAGCAFCGSDFGDFALARYNVEPGHADLSISKEGPPGRAPTGREMTYTLSVSNAGPDTALNTSLIDQLPASMSFVSAVPSQGSCSESGGTVTCILGVMANGATDTVEIVVTPNSAGVITNTASVTGFANDPNPSNNNDSENTSVCRITSRRSSIPCP